MVNFNIIENGESPWDKEPEIIELYNQGVPVAEIRAELQINSPTFNKILRKCKNDGKITPRRKPYKHQQKRNQKREPRYYYPNVNRTRFDVRRGKTFYGRVRNTAEAERYVELLIASGWDYDRRHELRKQAIKEVRNR